MTPVMIVRSAVSCTAWRLSSSVYRLVITDCRVDDPLLDQLHVARDVAHDVEAALLPGVNRPAEQRQRGAGKRHGLQRESHQHHVPAHARAVPRLLHGLHVGRIGLRLDLRRKRLKPRRLDDEVGAARHDGVAGPAPA